MHDNDPAARRLDVLANPALDLLPLSGRLIGRTLTHSRLLTDALQFPLTQACKAEVRISKAPSARTRPRS
jgi:hypothetical protein